MEAEHLQAPNSNRAWDEAEKQVVSFLRWLDKWDLDATPKGDEFHRESRIIFHIIIYKVINASRFPPTFLPSYMGKRTRAGIRNNSKNTEATQQSQSAWRVWESSCSLLPASIRMCSTEHLCSTEHPDSPGSRECWTGTE